MYKRELYNNKVLIIARTPAPFRRVAAETGMLWFRRN